MEIVADVPMSNGGFPDGFQMDGADFITVDLRKDLPVGDAEGLPLGLGAFRAIAKALGEGGAAVVHGHEEAVGGVRGTGGIRTGMKRLVEGEGGVFPDEGLP